MHSESVGTVELTEGNTAMLGDFEMRTVEIPCADCGELQVFDYPACVPAPDAETFLCSSCHDRKIQREREAAEKAKRESLLQRRLEESGLEQAWLGGFDAARPDANLALWDWASERYRSEKNMFITDASGEGKTRIVQELGRRWLLEHSGTLKYYSVPDLFNALAEAAAGDRRGNRYAKVIAGIFRADLLILDDLGKESVTESRMSQLWQILDKRYTGYCQKMNGLTPVYWGWRIWVTTQISSAELKERMGSKDGYAAIRRIQTSCEIWSPKTR